MYKYIEVEEKIPILILRLNRPDMQNKLNIEMMQEIISSLREAEKNSNIRAIVLSSKGNIFCGGGDLGNYKEKTVLELKRFGEEFINLHLSIIKLSKPIICAIKGGAFGGGLSLVDACDFAISGKDAKFGFPEIKVGLVPMMALAGIGRTLNKKLINYLSLTGIELSAEEAKNLGIINEIVENEMAEKRAIDFALEISEKDSIAIAFYKQLYGQIYEKDYEERIEKGLNVFINLLKAKGEID